MKGHGCERGRARSVDRRRRQLPPDGDGGGLLVLNGVGHDSVPHHGRPLLLLHRRHRRDVVGDVVWHGVVAVVGAEHSMGRSVIFSQKIEIISSDLDLLD